MIESDLCIIGGGTAGLAAAVAGAALGLNTVLVERDRRDETHRDSDTLLAVLAAQSMNARAHNGLDLTRLRDRIDAALAAAAPERRLARVAALNVRVMRGHARFVGPRSVAVDGTTVAARRFLLATGALPAPSRLGADHIVELDTFRLMPFLPPNLLLIGGDGTTVALAQTMGRFGGGVTLCAPSGLLPDVDPELVVPLRRQMRQDGIVLVETMRPQLAATAGGIEAALGNGRRLLASHVYDDAWADPMLDDLGLDRAGIATSAMGLVLSPTLRTTNRRVYAAGALAGAASPQAVQAQVATIVKAAFFRLPVPYRPTLVPRTVATVPAIATVGLDETEARRLGPIAVWRWPLAETQAGRTGPGVGHVKAIATPGGRLLGAGIVGPAAAEQIGLWTLALATGTTVQQVAETALPASAYADASRRALTGFTAERLRGRGLRWALAVLNRLG